MTTLAVLSTSDWITLALFATGQLAGLALLVFKLDKGLSLLTQRFDYLSESLTKDLKEHDSRIDSIEAAVFRRSKSKSVLDTP